MRNLRATGVLVAFLAAIGLSSCGGSSTMSTGVTNEGAVFTVGTDAPLPAVVSCQILVNSVTLFNGTTNVPVMTTPQVVDFAQLSGLHQLMDLNAGTDGNVYVGDGDDCDSGDRVYRHDQDSSGHQYDERHADAIDGDR